MLYFIIESQILHLIIILVCLNICLVLLPINSVFHIKLLWIIFNMIVSRIKINFFIRYYINCRHLCFLCHGDPLYCHGGELIQYQILITLILKPHQEPTITRGYLNHTSELLPHPPGKSLPNLILQITYLCLLQHTHWYNTPHPPPPLHLYMC